MARYRQRPLEVDAVQFTGHNRAEIEAMLRPGQESPFSGGDAIGALGIYDRNGRLLIADPGDWVVRDADGKGFYPVKPDVFGLAYEPV